MDEPVIVVQPAKDKKGSILLETQIQKMESPDVMIENSEEIQVILTDNKAKKEVLHTGNNQLSANNLKNNQDVIEETDFKLIEVEEGEVKSPENSRKLLKGKDTENRITIKRVMSEGEASSEFETISSIDSKTDIEELNLSSSIEEGFNVIVEIENELAFHYNTDKGPARHCRTDRYFGDYTNRRQDNSRNFREQKHWEKNSDDKNHKYDRRDKNLNDREDPNMARRLSSYDRDRDRRSKGKGRNEYDSRSKASRSPSRSIWSQNVSYKERKSEVRCSGSFEKSSKSNSKRNSPPPRKKRRNSFSRSPSSAVWKRLDDRASCNRSKVNQSKREKRSSRNSSNSLPRKKERTPFLVELERKLEEAKRSKNSKKNVTDTSKTITKTLTNVSATVQELPNNQNQNFPQSTPCMSTPQPNQVPYPFQYSIPTLSVDNLPLVPGPTGLPVHITVTGEHIPHDMDGKRIPIGPNGFYLPLDPTGRLFAHIVSPGNQAVPVHMTEDGVLRLPNSEPVPYGLGHQLPVNVDGSVILIGPDGKLLYPCTNLPREPPHHLMQIVNYPNGIQQTQTIPQTSQTGNQLAAQVTISSPVMTDEITEPQSVMHPSLLGFVQNPSEKVNTPELLKEYKIRARKRRENVLKCVEIEKNLGVKPSKGGVKRSTPMKLRKKKMSKHDEQTSGPDIVLDSDDANSFCGLNSTSNSTKGVAEEITINSDGEEGISNGVSCNNFKTSHETKPEDLIAKKVHRAITSLCETNYSPPAVGRFILSEFIAGPMRKYSLNESPLLRNRIGLPYLNPDSSQSHPTGHSEAAHKTGAPFKFLPQKKKPDRGEKSSKLKLKPSNNNIPARAPVFTFDFAMQCDLTSVIIKNLNSKVSELEKEIVSMRNRNVDLVDDYKKLQGKNEVKDEELRKALLEIQEKSDEIEFLKRKMEGR